MQRRRTAALAGHLGDIATVRELLTDEDPTVRATALGALSRIGDLAAADLTAAMADASPVVRSRAATEAAAVAAHPPAHGPVVVSLLGLLDDDDASVVEVTAWACGEQLPPDPVVIPVLVELAVHHDNPLVREAAVAALGSIGDPKGLPAILSATTDKPAVRRRAVLALAPFEGPEVDQALERAAKDRDWQVRQAAEDLTDPS